VQRIVTIEVIERRRPESNPTFCCLVLTLLDGDKLITDCDNDEDAYDTAAAAAAAAAAWTAVLIKRVCSL